MIESLESTWRSARHAVKLVVTDVATVAPGCVIAGVLLHVLHQVVRTRGWFNIIRVAHPDVHGLRARDVTLAYLAGAGLNGVAPARGGDVVKLYLIRRRASGTRWSTLFGTCGRHRAHHRVLVRRGSVAVRNRLGNLGGDPEV
jgi:hypothetical protein